MIPTYNHSDMLLSLLQEILQKLCCAAQGQVLKCICGPMPQLQHIQPISQPGQMDHFSVAESAEGSVDQVCGHRRWRALLYLPSSSLSVSLHFWIWRFYLYYRIKRAEIFILHDTMHEYYCILLQKFWEDMNQTVDRVLIVIPQRAEMYCNTFTF